MSQHHTWRGAVATWVVGGRTARGFLARPLVAALPLLAQHAGQAGFAAQVHALVGQHGHDARRWHVGEARLVGHAQQLRALGRAQGMCRYRAHRLRPAIARYQPFMSLPALQGAHVDAGDLASQVQPCAGSMRRVDVLGQGLAILCRSICHV